MIDESTTVDVSMSREEVEWLRWACINIDPDKPNREQVDDRVCYALDVALLKRHGPITVRFLARDLWFPIMKCRFKPRLMARLQDACARLGMDDRGHWRNR